MRLEKLRFVWGGHLLAHGDSRGRILATVLAAAVAAYLIWKIAQSPDQAVQFAYNGLSVGAVYALLAMGFTIVYSTVWFFDLYYGAAAAVGAYGVFYLRSQDAFGGPRPYQPIREYPACRGHRRSGRVGALRGIFFTSYGLVTIQGSCT